MGPSLRERERQRERERERERERPDGGCAESGKSLFFFLWLLYSVSTFLRGR